VSPVTDRAALEDIDRLKTACALASGEIESCGKETMWKVQLVKLDPRDATAGGCMCKLAEDDRCGDKTWMKRGRKVGIEEWEGWWQDECPKRKKVIWFERSVGCLGTRDAPFTAVRLGLEGDGAYWRHAVLSKIARGYGWRFSMMRGAWEAFVSTHTRLVPLSSTDKSDVCELSPFVDVEALCTDLISKYMAEGRLLGMAAVGSESDCLRVADLVVKKAGGDATLLHPFCNTDAVSAEAQRVSGGSSLTCVNVHDTESAVSALNRAVGPIILHGAHRFDVCASIEFVRVMSLADAVCRPLAVTCIPGHYMCSPLISQRPLLGAIYSGHFDVFRGEKEPSGVSAMIASTRLDGRGIHPLFGANIFVSATLTENEVKGIQKVVCVPRKPVGKRKRELDSTRQLLERAVEIEKIDSVCFTEQDKCAIVITGMAHAADICAAAMRMCNQNAIVVVECQGASVVNAQCAAHGALAFVV